MRILCAYVLILFLFAWSIGVLHAEEGDLKTLILNIGSAAGNPEVKKQALIALEKRANLGEYAVGEMVKRGVIPPLIDTLVAEYGDPLAKELALAVLSQMTMHSVGTCNSVVEKGLLAQFSTIIRRGTTTSQLHAVAIILHIVNLSKVNRQRVSRDNPILEAVVFALRTGTKETREKAATLIASLLASEQAKQQIIAVGAVEHLQKLTLHGTNKAKQYAAKALERLGADIPAEANIPPPTSSSQAPPSKHGVTSTDSSSNNNNNMHHKQHQQDSRSSEDSMLREGDVRTHTFTFSGEQAFARVLDDPVKEWWGSSLRQTRKVAQNQYTLRSPSRFRHK